MRHQGSRAPSTSRVLRGKTSKVAVRKCLAFDVETKLSSKRKLKLKCGTEYDIEEQEFMMGSAYVDGSTYSFWDAKSMREFMLKPEYSKYWKIATNLYFDCSMLFKDDIMQFDVCDWKFGEYKKHKFIDSIAYAPLSVKEQGKIIGLPKLDQPKAFLRMPVDEDEKREIEKYCSRDSEITGRFFEWFQEMLNSLGGEMKATAAQCSLELFKRKYLKIKIYGEDDKRQAFARLSYKGGRVECFKRGTFKDVFYYDVNSLYPFVMSKYSLPDPSSSHWKNHPTMQNIMRYEGVSEVSISCPEMKIPLLYAIIDKKLIFPTGHFKGVYTHCELREAMKLGYKVSKIKKQLVYTRCFDDYKSFVKDLYAKRVKYKQEENAVEFVIKLMMNSSYGKLGQDNSKMTKCVHISKVKDLSKIESFVGKPDYQDGWANVKDKQKTPAFVHVIVASYVTALARIHMHRMMREHDVIYTDTDSIITKDEMRHSRELGDLKLEKTIDVPLIVVRPKVYVYADSVRCKGFPGLKRDDFDKLLKGESFSYRKFSKFKESILREMQFNSVYRAEKNLDLEDNKRLWKHKFSLEPQESVPLCLS
jgi:hypothetical protein